VFDTAPDRVAYMPEQLNQSWISISNT